MIFTTDRKSNIPQIDSLTRILDFVGVHNSRLISKRLIDRFGSMKNVLNSDKKMLLKQPGIDEKSADLLLYIPKLSTFVSNEQFLNLQKITNYDDLGDYMKSFMAFNKTESFFIVLFDESGNIVDKDFFGFGSVRSAEIDVDPITSFLSNKCAKYAAISHSHPRGILIPSGDDYFSTMAIKPLFDKADIILLDHIIANQDNFISLAQSSEFEGFFGKADFLSETF